MNNTIKIYLCGSITPDIRTTQWRDEFTSIIQESEQNRVKIIDPTKNGFNKFLPLEQDYNTFYDNIDKTQNILKRVDYQLVKKSDVIICNVSFFNIEKPPIGTIYELAWADQHNIPVIGIISSQENPYIRHPWIKESFAYSVYDIKQAINIVKDFFMPYI